MSVAQIAVSAGVGRSTAGKLLSQLQSDRKVSRTGVGRGTTSADCPTSGRWTAAARHESKREGRRELNRRQALRDADRLKRGQLDPLVLAYLKAKADSGPHGPITVAKALKRPPAVATASFDWRKPRRCARLATSRGATASRPGS